MQSHWVGRARRQCWITTAASVSAKSVLEPHRSRAAGRSTCLDSRTWVKLTRAEREGGGSVYYIIIIIITTTIQLHQLKVVIRLEIILYSTSKLA